MELVMSQNPFTPKTIPTTGWVSDNCVWRTRAMGHCQSTLATTVLHFCWMLCASYAGVLVDRKRAALNIAQGAQATI